MSTNHSHDVIELPIGIDDGRTLLDSTTTTQRSLSVVSSGAGLLDRRDDIDDLDDLDQLHRSVELAKVRRSRGRGLVQRLDETVAALFITEVFIVVCVALFASTRYPSLLVATFCLTAAVVRLAWGGLRPRLNLSVIEDLGHELSAGLVVLGTTVVGLMVIDGDADVTGLVTLSIQFFFFAVVVRALAFALMRRRRRDPSARRRTLVIGAGPVGRHVTEGLLARPQFGLEPVGFLDVESLDDDSLPLPLLGHRMGDLAELIVAHDISTVIATFVADDESLVDVMLTSTRLDTEILVVPRLYELASDDSKTDWVNGVPLVRHTSGVTGKFSWQIKRLIDCSVAGLSLILLAPVLLAAAAAVLIDSGRPVFFRQRRIGVDGVPFELLKFRSMRPATELEGQTQWNIANDPRLGSIGKFLRRSSIDELPQLFNILRGEMSLVGPRPERPVFVEQFSAEHSRYWARHRLPVGLTGWAQVNGLRGDTSIATRARFDNFYIANWSLWLDFKIMLLTVREVLRGSGR